MNADLPNLAGEGFTETSPANPEYNCIAWAAGQTNAWWWPSKMPVTYWPEGVARTVTLEAFNQAFQTLGFSPCDNFELEAGFEKIALYVRDGNPTHAARQLPDGRWTSKLGRWLDITHTLRGLEGPAYGRAFHFLRRPLSNS